MAGLIIKTSVNHNISTQIDVEPFSIRYFTSISVCFALKNPLMGVFQVYSTFVYIVLKRFRILFSSI